MYGKIGWKDEGKKEEDVGFHFIHLPKSAECITSSSVTQCQVLNAVMAALRIAPCVTVYAIDLSKVKTRWRTVAVARSMERSSAGVGVSDVLYG